jgi:hypothetical protein
MESYKKFPPAEENVFLACLCSYVYTTDFYGVLNHSGVSERDVK